MLNKKTFLLMLALLLLLGSGFLPAFAQDNNSTETNQELYTVKSGDSLWLISRRLGVSLEKLFSSNGLQENSIIYVDQVLKVPRSNSENTGIREGSTKASPLSSTAPVTQITYHVQQGDTPWLISIKHGIPMAELLAANNLTESSILNFGQELQIPVHHIPVKTTISPDHGELLDWWTEAQYVWPIDTIATVIDFQSKASWQVIRSFGAAHADIEPLTAKDAEIMKKVWGGQWSWSVRPVIVVVNGHRIAASASSMPHSIEKIDAENGFNGHSDIHFLNSRRHKDNEINAGHQKAVHIAAGK